jgi:hypothetical protein
MPEIKRTGLPVRAALHPTGVYFSLRPIPPDELQDPFMHQTIARLGGTDAYVRIPPKDVGKGGGATAPAGIVLHVARSGSTLLSQLLKQHHGLVVYAEPQPVNEILMPPHKWPREALAAALRSLGVAFANHAGKPYVLKLSSWNTLFCDIVAEAFPTTPWVFALRDPLEVGVSLLHDGPGWFRDDQDPSRHIWNLIDPDMTRRSPEEFVAQAYGRFCQAIEGLDAGRGRLVSYPALPAAVWEAVVPHFGLPVTEAIRRRMAETARIYSKAPVGEPAEFAADTSAKRAAASPELQRAINALARPAYDRLIARHAGGG